MLLVPGDAPTGAKPGALVRTPPALLLGRGRPHVFVLRGLRPQRRYRITFAGLADAEARVATVRVPSAPPLPLV